MIEDLLYGLKDAYERSPAWLRELGGIAYRTVPGRFIHGPHYQRFKQLIARLESASAAELEKYQSRQLNALVQHAYDTVPFYRKSFDHAGIQPRDIRSVADLSHLPLLTKELLQEHRDELLSSSLGRRRRIYVTSGGSTGQPVGFYLQRWISRAKELAFMEDQWSRVGYRPGDRCAILRGQPLSGLPANTFWKRNPVRNSLVLSSYHLTETNAPAYVRQLREFRPRFLQAYPSSATLLATHMRDQNLAPLSGLHAVLAGSENLYPEQRELIEQVFGCRVFSWYGHSERLVLGGECEHSTDYHLYPQYGIAEVLSDTGRVLSDDGGVGEIVATGFHNHVMPLIRFRTMDRGEIATGNCACGRHYPRLRRIDGRLQELLITGQGRRISMTAMNMHSAVFDQVRQFQFHQTRPGHVDFVYVPRAGFAQSDEQRIRHEVGAKLGDDMTLTLKPTDHIPPTPSGKHRFLVQELDIGYKFAAD